MGKVISIDMDLSDSLVDHVADITGEFGPYDNIGDYVRDLITRDQDIVEQQRFEDLKAELVRAFATPDEDFREVSADDIIARAKRRMNEQL